MTHTFKLARRLSRFRAMSLASLLAVAGAVACDNNDPVDPTTDLGAIEPTFTDDIAFATAGSVTISNLSARSGKVYRAASGFASGRLQYADRSYTVKGSVPENLVGVTYIQTSNADKNAYTGSSTFLTFTIGVDANVYVAHDDRVARPTWLTSNFKDTGLNLASSDGVTTYSLFMKKFVRGNVTLGGNATTAVERTSMYFVLVQAIGETTAPSSGDPTARSGIPMGEFGLPIDKYGSGISTGGLKHLSTGSGLNDLAAAKKNGLRMVVSLAGGRSTFTNSDGTFNLTKWKANVAQWKSLNIAPYITDGTIVGHYLIDEPNWKGAWGGKTISQSTLQEMARYSKSIWPTMPTTIRVHASYLSGYSWPNLDFAWSQWEGRLHGTSAGMTVEAWRDKQTADARALGLKIMFGMNYLDGGDGSSKISGTYDLRTVSSRWQMSAAEVERVGKVLAAAGCGVISWRWSPNYPSYSYHTTAQREGIRNFHNRSDVKAAIAAVTAVAKARPATSCKR